MNQKPLGMASLRRVLSEAFFLAQIKETHKPKLLAKGKERQMRLRSYPVIGAATLLLVINGLLSGCQTSLNSQSTATPVDLYPSPQPFSTPVNGLSASGCPSLANVEKAEQLPMEVVFASLSTLSSGEAAMKQQVSDPSFWDYEWSPPWEGLGKPQASWLAIHPAKDTPYKSLISIACGQETLDLSWWVEACAGECKTSSPALTAHYYFIQRENTWLIWASYP